MVEYVKSVDLDYQGKGGLLFQIGGSLEPLVCFWIFSCPSVMGGDGEVQQQ